MRWVSGPEPRFGLNAIDQMLVMPACPACPLMIIAMDVVALCGYGSHAQREAV